MPRHQGIYRIPTTEFYELVQDQLLPPSCDYTVVGIVQNPYNDSVDILLEDESLAEVAQFAAPPILNLGGTAGPNDYAMDDSTKQ